eukprot:3941008-Rhodomonas_salina.2
MAPLTEGYVCSVVSTAALLSSNPAHFTLTTAEVAADLMVSVLSSSTVTSVIQGCAVSATEVIACSQAAVQLQNDGVCPAAQDSGATLQSMHNILATTKDALFFVFVKYGANIPAGSGAKAVTTALSETAVAVETVADLAAATTPITVAVSASSQVSVLAPATLGTSTGRPDATEVVLSIHVQAPAPRINSRTPIAPLVTLTLSDLATEAEITSNGIVFAVTIPIDASTLCAAETALYVTGQVGASPTCGCFADCVFMWNAAMADRQCGRARGTVWSSTAPGTTAGSASLRATPPLPP